MNPIHHEDPKIIPISENTDIEQLKDKVKDLNLTVETLVRDLAALSQHQKSLDHSIAHIETSLNHHLSQLALLVTTCTHSATSFSNHLQASLERLKEEFEQVKEVQEESQQQLGMVLKIAVQKGVADGILKKSEKEGE